jgi:quercetin dioxygenase-like cupin family protein
MAYKGQVLDNPVSGERFVFHLTADDTAGELLAFDVTIAPDGQVPGAHVHPTQEERFEVVSGVVKFRKGLKTVVASAGDVVVVPPGTAHRFTNASDEEAVMRVHVTPALKTEELFETAIALANEGRTFRSGMPKPLDLALFMREFSQEVKAPMGAGVVRAVTAPLAWLASRRGLDRRYRIADARRRSRRGPVPSGPGEGRSTSVRPPSRPSTPRGDRIVRPKSRP